MEQSGGGGFLIFRGGPRFPARSHELQQDKPDDFVISTGEQVVLIKSKVKKVRKKYTISGYVTDAATGEALVGTNIYGGTLHTGCSTNGYGFYSLTIPAGSYAITYNYIGYELRDIHFNLNRSIKFDVELKEIAILGETVTVTAETEDRNIESTDMGTIHFVPFKLNTIPVFLGEQDIFRTVQLLPGVAHGREGSCGFFVRGGNSDQNLILLDEAPVYNAYHLLGFFSVFNSDALKDVKLIKGAAPPKYGGRLSSVLDIQMNEGNSKKINGNAGIGLIFSRLTLQGPIIKDIGSYIITGRRTYVDLFTRFAPDTTIKNSILYFYDFNAKVNYKISGDDRIYLSGYFGKDRFGMNELVDISWGNKTATLLWNHLISNKLFLNSSLIFSNFKYITKVIEDTVVVTSKINDFTLKEDFQFFFNSKNTFNFGFNYIYHNFQAGNISVAFDSGFDISIGKRNAPEVAAYVAHECDVTDRLKLNYGLRYSRISVVGDGDEYSFNDMNDVPDDFIDIDFHERENVTYQGLEPRFFANYLLNKSSSLKLGMARNYQHIHLLTSSSTGFSINMWQPSNEKVKPQCADQVSLGYFKKLL